MTIEKTISNLVESQFPAFYQDEGPVFIEFVKAYYEWLEEANGAVREARTLLEYHDIDTTVDSFLIHFKNKYLNNLQFETAVASRDMVKHSLDLYRSKGTERSIDLFFKSVFAVPATIYYPGTDMFKTSAATWIEPVYLEVDPTENIYDFIGVQIEGVTSGATAFVDRYSKKKAKDSTYITHVLYMQNVVGDFITGEKIMISRSGVIGPTIIGSLNLLEVTDGAGGYELGDLVYLNSTYSGKNGKARVTGVQSVSGRTEFILIDGGWGYNANSEVIISEKALTIANLHSDSGNFSQFEAVYQEMANIAFTGLTGGEFEEGDFVYRRSSVDGSIVAQGVVVDVGTLSGTNGSIVVNFIDGPFGAYMQALNEDGGNLEFENGVEVDMDGIAIGSDAYVYKIESTEDESGQVMAYEDLLEMIYEQNTVSATISSMTDVSAFANVMQIASNSTLVTTNSEGQFATGEYIYQLDTVNGGEYANGVIVAVSYSAANGLIQVVNVAGDWVLDEPVLSRNTSSTGVLSEIGERIGVFEIEGTFSNVVGNVVRGTSSETTGTITGTSEGFGAYFDLVNTFSNEEEVTIVTDIVGDYITVGLDEDDYGFPSPGSSNVDSLLLDTFSYDTAFYGTITAIVLRSPGEDYNGPPFVVVHEPKLARFNKRDYYVTVFDTVGSFAVGEIVTVRGEQRGIVISANSTSLHLKRISFDDITMDDILGTEDPDFYLEMEDESAMESEQNNASVVGLSSGATAQVDTWQSDENSEKIGLNAVVFANTTTANGSVTSLRVVDSGFNYFTGETVTFYSDSDSIIGQAEVTEMKQGRAMGYYKSNDSELSGTKYLQDSDYYQTFSYEIRSGISLDRYADMLKNILHPSGTKSFSRFINETEIDATTTIDSTVTIE